MAKSIAEEEGKIPKTLTYLDRQEPPTDFKAIDLLHNCTNLKASQLAYLNEVDIPAVLDTWAKDELQRKLTPEENTTLKSIANKLAAVATCTSPLYVFHASTSLQRPKKTLVQHSPLSRPFKLP